MNAILSGVFVGVLVFLLLVFAFASATGTMELVLWGIVATVAGVLVTHRLKRAVERPSPN